MARSSAARQSRAPDSKKQSPAAEPAPAVLRPLNAEGSFALWPSFDPGRFIDMNPSLVRFGPDDAWAIFCRYQSPPQPGQGSIWAVRVDADLRPSGQPVQLLAQGIDPRAIRLGDRVLIFLALIERDPKTDAPNGSSVAMVEFTIDGGQWTCGAMFGLPKRPIQGQQPAEYD